MKTKAIINCLVFLATFNFCLGQEIPKVVGPSPETSSLFRFLDHPVDHSTGVPQISIPIYEVKSGSLNVPVSISYHAGGRRVTDETGPVGLGWSLNAGGMISRTIYGKPDEVSPFPSELKLANTLSNQNDYEYLANIYNGPSSYSSLYDSEFDVFSYSVGSHSGKFVLSADKTALYLLPQKSLKILPEGGNGSNYAFPSVIIDDKGITYNFSEVESYNDGNPYYSNAVTGKLLSSIISADKKDTIFFTYQSFSKLNGFPTETYSLYDDNSTNIQNPGGNNYPSQINQEQRWYTIKRLKEIVFRDGKVVFNLVQNSDRVNNIEIKRKNGTIVRTIQLVMSQLDNAYSSTDMYTHKLDQLQFKDQDLTTIENYSFDYNASSNFNRLSRDFAGYRNGSSQTVGTLSYTGVTFLNPGTYSTTVTAGSGANRNSSLDMAQGVLKKITYPTGGSTEFSYEMNKIKVLNTDYYPGGLRVTEIKTSDDNGNIHYKTYKYGQGESGYGIKQLFPFEMGDMHYETRVFPYVTHAGGSEIIKSYRKRIYSSEFLPEISYIANEPVFYPEVTEYEGTFGTHTGKTIYKYENPYATGLENKAYYYPDPSFPASVVWQGTYQGPYDFSSAIDNTLKRMYVGQFKLWNHNPLIEKIVYKKTSGSTYQAVKKIEHGYNSVVTDTLTGLYVYKFLEIPGGGSPAVEHKAAQHGLPVFNFANYQMTVGKKELAGTSETDYNDNGQIVNITNYTYNSNNLVSETKQFTSKGDELVTKIKYPFDFTSDVTIGSVSQTMVAAHMINYPIEQSTYKNTNNFLQATKTHYYDWGSNIIAPKTVFTRQGSGSDLARVQYHSYDAHGNLTAVSKESDVQKVYIWGYNKTYPVAEVVGMSYSTAMAVLTQSILDDPADDATLRSHLNNLRNISGAMVTTYTYKPLVGMTSATDANGNTTYYQYDAYGRLFQIRDKDNNILKRFCYNYKGQVEACTVTPQWQATGSYRCVTNGIGENIGYQEKLERDMNPISDSYFETRWVSNGYNTTACPLPCSYWTCQYQGEGYNCIYGQCELGYKVYTNCQWDSYSYMWLCTYHYEFSDGSWSGDYYVYCNDIMAVIDATNKF